MLTQDQLKALHEGIRYRESVEQEKAKGGLVAFNHLYETLYVERHDGAEFFRYGPDAWATVEQYKPVAERYGVSNVLDVVLYEARNW